MRANLPYRVVGPGGTTRGRVLFAEDAAALVSLSGPGATVRRGRRVLWTEGEDGDGYAGGSYDATGATIAERDEG